MQSHAVIALSLLGLVVATRPSAAQVPRLRFTAAVSRASVIDDRAPPSLPGGVLPGLDRRLGFSAGASYDVPLSGPIGMRPALHFAQRGWAFLFQPSFNDPTIARQDVVLDVLELALPVRLTIPFGTGFRASLVAGPAVSVRMRCFLSFTGYSYARTKCEGPLPIPPGVRKTQTSVTVGLNVERALDGGWMGGAVRYIRGLGDPVDGSSPSGLTQQVLEAGASYAPGRGVGRWLGRAGRVSLGGRAGWNRAIEEVHNTDMITYLERLPVYGFHAGALARLRLAPLLAVQSEVTYTQEGTAWNDAGTLRGGEVQRNLDFLQIPLLLMVSTPPIPVAARVSLRPYALGGPAIGWQVSAERERASVIVDIDGEVDGIQPSLIGGAGVEMMLGRYTIGLEVRHQRGTLDPQSNVFSFEPDPKTHSRVWSVSAVFTRVLRPPR